MKKTQKKRISLKNNDGQLVCANCLIGHTSQWRTYPKPNNISKHCCNTCSCFFKRKQRYPTNTMSFYSKILLSLKEKV
jgi:hypothetical protein